MKNFVKFRREALGNVLKENGLHGKGIEIGVAAGTYSKIILNNFGLEKLYLLDNWEGYRCVSQKNQDIKYKQVEKLASQYEDVVEIVKGDSDKACELFKEEYFDFIYIDADHIYESVIKDLNLWYPKLKNGGLFSGHDYTGVNNEYFGVTRAVDEFCAGLEIDFFVTQGTRRIPPSWYFIKRGDI